MSANQVPGHLYGPARPHIAFYYGAQYLGEVSGHPNDIQAAQGKLLASLDVLDPGDRTNQRERILAATHVKVYCGDICVKFAFRDATSALWNKAEYARQNRRHGHIVH